MSIRRSHFLVILALTAGTLSPFAFAGDKIEFSAATNSLAVPHIEKEDKSAAKSALDEPLRPDAAILDQQMQGSQEVIIVSARKKKTSAWDSDSRDNNRNDPYQRDDTADEKTRDEFDARPRPNNCVTNLWQVGRQWEPDTTSTFSESRRDGLGGQDNLRSRLETLHEATGSDLRRDEHYGGREDNSEEDSVWSSSFFHHGLMGAEQRKDDQYRSFNEVTKAFGQESTQTPSDSRDRLYNAADEALRDSKLPPGLVDYDAQMDAGRIKSTEEMLALPPRHYEPVETKPVTVDSSPYARQAPPASPPGQVQSPPAILPFPKRPGSLFQ